MNKKIIFPMFPLIILSSVCSYYYGYSVAKKKYEKEKQQVIDEYVEMMKEKKAEVETYVEVHNKANAYSTGGVVPTNDSVGVSSDSSVASALKEEYESLIDDCYYEEDEVPGPSESSDDPYPIPYEKYAEENYHFDKKSILYYEENDVLIYAESEEPIYDDVMLFGQEWREELDIYHHDIGYIRNESLSTDFEIIIKKEEYKGDDYVE